MMESRYATPRELIEALHQRGRGARAQLGQFLRAPLGQLLGQFITRHGLDEDRDVLLLHALHAAETYARTLPLSTFERLSWPGLRAALLLHVAKVAFQPHGGAVNGSRPGLPGPQSLPECPVYYSQTFSRPYERLGDHWFGGDWLTGRLAADGALWVLIADVTGHGYYAYLLASGLPAVWRRCWESLPDSTAPAEVLAAMHHFLGDCLPDGVFVECTLARLGPDGSVTVAPAGGTRLLLRQAGEARPRLLKLRGMWLGLHPPSLEDQRRWSLAHHDELLLASDGVFDQLADHGGAESVRLLEGASATLFDAVQELLNRSLAQGPQHDDLTMVLVRRRPAAKEALAPAGKRAGDVPV
jgi:hypothetical protein